MKDHNASVNFDLSEDEATNQVLLSINAGEGQVKYSVFKDFQGRYVNGDVQNYPLGSVSDVRGKNLLVISIVTDTNPHTNRTSLKVTVNNERTRSLATDADEDNGTVSYNTIINFQ